VRRAARWALAGRVLAACVGGYGLGALAAAVLALALSRFTPVSAAMGVTVGSLLSFVFYTAVAIAVFGVRSAGRAWALLAAAALVLGALLLVLRSGA
jgi:hypothetical protein